MAVPLVLLSFNWYEQLLIEFLWWHVTILLIAGTSALLFWAFRDRIFHKLRLTTKTALEDVADPLLEMLNSIIAGNGSEASTQAKVFVRRFLSRLAAIKSMAWIVGTVFGFLAIFATMAASAILVKQNAIITSQNTLIESQNKYFQEQNQKIQLQIDNQLNEERNARRNKLIEILYEEINDQPDRKNNFLNWLDSSSKSKVASKTSKYGALSDYYLELMQQTGGEALQKAFNAKANYRVKQPKYNLRSRYEAFFAFVKAETDDGIKNVNLSSSILDEISLSEWSPDRGALLDLSNSQIREGYFEFCDFSDFILNYSNLENCEFFDCNLNGAKLNGVNLANANLTFSDFSNVNMLNASLNNATLQGAAFCGTNLDFSNFSGAVNLGFNKKHILPYSRAGYLTIFAGSSMTGTNFNDAFMTFSVFHRVDLTNSTLSKTKFDGSVFIESNLSNVILKDSSLIGSYFDRAILNNAKMDGAILENVSFVGADLRGASFENAKFSNVNFEDAIVDSRNWFDEKTVLAPSLSRLKQYWRVEETRSGNGARFLVIKLDETVAKKPEFSRLPSDGKERINSILDQIETHRGIYLKDFEPKAIKIEEAPPPPRKPKAK